MSRRTGPEFEGEQPVQTPTREAETLRRFARDAGRAIPCEGARGVVPGEGDAAASLIIVGEAPGEQEDRLGRPFVGRSGALLDEALSRAGLTRERLWITNAVKCRPVKWEGDRARNRPPTAAELRAWRPTLETELRVIRPRVIVALGAVAGKALAGAAFSITRARGTWSQDLILGADLLVTWHPAYILRQTGNDREARLNELERDFAAVRARLAGAD